MIQTLDYKFAEEAVRAALVMKKEIADEGFEISEKKVRLYQEIGRNKVINDSVQFGKLQRLVVRKDTKEMLDELKQLEQEERKIMDEFSLLNKTLELYRSKWNNPHLSWDQLMDSLKDEGYIVY